MVLIFIDASGTTSFNDPEPLYALNAILIKERDYVILENNIFSFKEEICNDYDYSPDIFLVKKSLVSTYSDYQQSD